MAVTEQPSPRDEAAPADSVSVVGIGCSAGGLEALEEFFAQVPRGSGLAFVVVQHLAPAYASALAEILQHATTMPVIEAADGMTVAPDNVYVIPPNHDLSLLKNQLYLLDPPEPRGLRLPIDFFFRSLAADRQDRAIGIILSGMGSDGVAGLKAIKERAGLTLAQTPSTAQSGSMPSAAIAAGVADIVAAPADLPARLIATLSHPTQAASRAPPLPDAVESDLRKIILLLRDRSGNDFSLYKTTSLLRRIERRIALHQLASIADYARYLRDTPHEIDLLFKELLIGVTAFFRDPDIWSLLRQEAIPALLARHPRGRPIRVWVPACSSGEEAYSLAMLLRESIDAGAPDARPGLQIYATDLDPDAIDRARKGSYPETIAADVAPDRLARHFILQDGRYRISPKIRETVVFATQNIVADPPFTRLDMISCRNLLIYLQPTLQARLLTMFHYALNPDGLLLLGSAETIGGHGDLFVPQNNKARLYQRAGPSRGLHTLELPFMTSRTPKNPVLPLVVAPDEAVPAAIDKFIQKHYAPAAVLINQGGDILYISGRTGKYLEPAAGKTNNNIHAMARPGLSENLSGLISQALSEAAPVVLAGVRVGTNGGTQTVDVTAQALHQPDSLRSQILIVFKDVAGARGGRRSGRADRGGAPSVQEELQRARDALQASHEEMQTSVEELRSTNEELQSTNEELTTSKEEMQSLNEELQTVNTELHSKVEILTEVQNDLTNLLNSTEIATVFLDGALKVRRFTSQATAIFKLLPVDIGRPLSDVACSLDYPQLMSAAQSVLSSLAFHEGQGGTKDGRWMRVRIMPYRTQENVIDGLVMTFTDISEVKTLQEQLRATKGSG